MHVLVILYTKLAGAQYALPHDLVAVHINPSRGRQRVAQPSAAAIADAPYGVEPISEVRLLRGIIA